MQNRTVFASIPTSLGRRSQPLYVRKNAGVLTRARARIRHGLGNIAHPIRQAIFEISAVGRFSSQELDDLRDSQKGQVGVVVCNGPSLNETDFSEIQDLPYILLNRGGLLLDRFTTAPAAICVHDPLVIDQFIDEIAEVDSPLFAESRAISRTSRRDKAVFLRIARTWGFATRLGLSTHHGYTVTFWALEVAYHLGWSKVIIIGMDHRFAVVNDPSQARRVEGEDVDHFIPSYYPPGTLLLNPDVDSIEYSYALARCAWEDDAREIVDCTPGGACKVFRKSVLSAELRR